MPTLNWLGKEKVVTHHQDVPYKILEHQYGFTAEKGKQEKPTESGNKICEYIYYTETQQHLKHERSEQHKYLLDTYNETGYYFYYEADKATTPCMETLSIASEKADNI